MATKTVKVATVEYRNGDGKRKRAYFGDEIDVAGDELQRLTKAGVFDQPPAGPVDTPFIATPVVANGFAAALADIEPRTPEPVGDDGTAKLHHNVQPPAAAAAEPESEDGGDESQLSESGRPLKVANKPVLVTWLAERQSKFSREELEQLNKDDLWELIDKTPETTE